MIIQNIEFESTADMAYEIYSKVMVVQTALMELLRVGANISPTNQSILDSLESVKELSDTLNSELTKELKASPKNTNTEVTIDN